MRQEIVSGEVCTRGNSCRLASTVPPTLKGWIRVGRKRTHSDHLCHLLHHAPSKPHTQTAETCTLRKAC
jgi:hypothetical protein